MTAGTRRNGTSKLGPFNRTALAGTGLAGTAMGGTALAGTGLGGSAALDPRGPWGGRNLDYTGRHVSHRTSPARARVGKAVPVMAVAATLATGAAAYTLAGVAHTHLAGLNGAAALSGTASGTASGTVGGTRTAVAGSASEAAAAIGRLATATASVPKPAHAYVPRHAKPAVETASAVAATAAASPAAAVPSAPAAAVPSATAPASAPAASAPASAPSASAPAAAPSQPAAATLSCDTSDGLLPENVTAIVSFLLAHGYSDNAAAGIAGNIYQESTGNPEAVGDGGGGLIGWTPLPAGYISGDVAADLETQLAGVLTYDEEWSSYLSALNSAATPADAAYIYVTDFERAGIPAAATRETVAEDVASACGI